MLKFTLGADAAATLTSARDGLQVELRRLAAADALLSQLRTIVETEAAAVQEARETLDLGDNDALDSMIRKQARHDLALARAKVVAASGEEILGPLSHAAAGAVEAVRRGWSEVHGMIISEGMAKLRVMFHDENEAEHAAKNTPLGLASERFMTHPVGFVGEGQSLQSLAVTGRKLTVIIEAMLKGEQPCALPGHPLSGDSEGAAGTTTENTTEPAVEPEVEVEQPA